MLHEMQQSLNKRGFPDIFVLDLLSIQKKVVVKKISGAKYLNVKKHL
jgi:hypothetical protein